MPTATILIVDDDATLLESLGRALGRTYRVLLAESGADALQLLEQETVDVVVSDHHMPGMTGAQLLQQVATRREGTVRILSSAQPDLAMAIKAINQGDVFRILVKPVELAELQVAVHLAVEKLQLEREHRALRSLVAAHPELERELEQRLSALWPSKGATP
ncbi:MAG: response regulator [Bacteroidetes bacterium]|nr:response regulator [Bacteroidota bacterium]MBK9517777.1 response regulator [Anaeromyxobacter sp.]MBL0276698.1 response regulator [Anaeromyxobacter sp.]